jgi:hypothetical protein
MPVPIVRRANGSAFLDDDDEWLPNKLERQITFTSARAPALVSCLSRVVTPTATYVWPQVIYDNSTPLDEYLFDRRSAYRTGLLPNIQLSDPLFYLSGSCPRCFDRN